VTRDTTITELDRVQADSATAEADAVFQMDEETFRSFYDRTARPLWGYLARLTGDPAAADDLLQETYYKFLRSRSELDGDAHCRHYLFRIATNLVNDRRRRGAHDRLAASDEALRVEAVDAGAAARTERNTDVSLAMARLKPRERALLWLAYANGSSHREIAEVLGLSTGSVKPLLFRARRRLAALLTRRIASPARAGMRQEENEEPGDAR
jgi:RNA polymerase sigma-70 factor, ECF subfamily